MTTTMQQQQQPALDTHLLQSQINEPKPGEMSLFIVIANYDPRAAQNVPPLSVTPPTGGVGKSSEVSHSGQDIIAVREPQ